MRTPDTSNTLEHLIAAAREGRVGRRGFIRGAMATGAAAGVASGLWSGTAQAQTPKRGGTFRVGVHDGSTTDSWDPGTTASIFMIQINHAVRSFLTEITNTNELGPDLATEWAALTDDASEWRFALAQNATFHDGRAVTSADVVASMNHHRGPETTSGAASLLSDVTDIRADGDHAVIFTLGTGNADLPYLLSDYHLVILPANDDGTVDWRNGTGSGPYKLEGFQPGIDAELVRHDGWHRAGEGAWFDAVTMTVLNDPNARQTAIVTGAVDAVTDIDLKTIDLLARAPGVIIDDVPSGTHVTMPMFTDVAPFDDINVRMALKYSIDRQEVVDKILFGRGTLGNDQPIGPTIPYYADLEQRTYDPDRARFHMKEAGLESLDVNLSVTDTIVSGAVNMCSLYAEQAKPAGININVVREPADGYWSTVWLKKPFCVVSWAGRPTPDVMFSQAYKAGAAWNESHWDNARFNELLLAARVELDEALRGEMYAEMQGLVRDDGGTVVPFFRNRTGARRDNVMHTESIASIWELDGARAYQRWWFA